MAMSKAKLNIVVAACNNNMGIGKNGKLPWRLKKDMAFFKAVTSTTCVTGKQNMVIMGKNTWLSIPQKFRPLSGRVNVVLSRHMDETPKGAHLARSFQEALELADSMKDTVDQVFVIGGSSVYKEAMSSLTNDCRIYFTRVFGDFDCDAFFPEISSQSFHKVDNFVENVPSEDQEEDGIAYVFEVYERN